MNKLQCVAGCKYFTGGEIKHHEECPYYPESLSKMYNDLKIKLESFDVENIQNQAKKDLLTAYYVAIFERNMSVEDIMQSIEADRQFLDGEIVLAEVRSVLNTKEIK